MFYNIYQYSVAREQFEYCFLYIWMYAKISINRKFNRRIDKDRFFSLRYVRRVYVGITCIACRWNSAIAIAVRCSVAHGALRCNGWLISETLKSNPSYAVVAATAKVRKCREGGGGGAVEGPAPGDPVTRSTTCIVLRWIYFIDICEHVRAHFYWLVMVICARGFYTECRFSEWAHF